MLCDGPIDYRIERIERCDGGVLPVRQITLERDGREHFWPSVKTFGMVPIPTMSERYRFLKNQAEQAQRITVNKTTHRIRFENQTESSVDVVIEPKEQVTQL